MNNNKSIHEGHRQRLKNKFLENGFVGFEHHNILEMLLFYSIPRRDTNEIAHELLNRFGSLKNVFNAEFDELIQVNGISENSATLIKMVPQIAREYLSDYSNSKVSFDSEKRIGEYFVNKYIGETKEVVYAMLLNSKFELIDCIKIHEGSVNSAFVSPRKIIDSVVKQNAAMVVLAHNHPDGSVCPSMEDISTTANLISIFRPFDIALVEHFLVAGNSYSAIIRETQSLGNLNRHCSSTLKNTTGLNF